MNMHSRFNQVVGGALAAAITLTAFAPAAFAGHGGKSMKYRGGGYAREAGYYPQQRPVVVERHSSVAGPVIAGVIGGIALGTILASHSHNGDRQQVDYGYEGGYQGGYGGDCSRSRVSVHGHYGDNCGNQGAYYYYEDPWDGQRYDNLNVYRNQCNGHWPIARVVDARSGNCVQYICWHDGGWYNYDASDPPWACNDRGNHRGGGYHGDRDYDRDDQGWSRNDRGYDGRGYYGN